MFKSLRRPREFYKYLIALTAPIALQHLITFSLGLIDTFMVSQLGNKEMAAVTTANVPVFLLLSLGFGVQGGLGILVSQYWGKRDMKNISRAIGVALFIYADPFLAAARSHSGSDSPPDCHSIPSCRFATLTLCYRPRMMPAISG